MPAATRSRGAAGADVYAAQNAAVVTANETNQLKVGPGLLRFLAAFGPGTTWVADVYDNASGNSGPIWQWVSADGKVPQRLDLPFANGLRVVTSGTTPGSLVVVWS